METFSFLRGVRIVETESVGDPWPDWSRVRSPSRAARRLKRGFRQNIITRHRANGTCIRDEARGVIYVHPDDARRLSAALGVAAL